MKNIEQKRQSLKDNFNYITDKQIEFIFDILNLPQFANKKDLFNLSRSGKDWTKIDTATPIDYYRKIELLYPGFKNGNLCYDYNKISFGEMLNINDLVINRILKLNS